ncbi:MAG: hypothetical protein KA281_00535 [Bacteroidia bacterium]|nr:hypothetical protein [Bacteroidia bacterium]
MKSPPSWWGLFCAFVVLMDPYFREMVRKEIIKLMMPVFILQNLSAQQTKDSKPNYLLLRQNKLQSNLNFWNNASPCWH